MLALSVTGVTLQYNDQDNIGNFDQYLPKPNHKPQTMGIILLS